MPRILVTNDDGVHAEGIKALAAALTPLGEVTVVAPITESSAIGHALTLRRPLRIDQMSDGFYAVDGTPTDCVNLGVAILLKGELPSLVVSGINTGWNLGDDVTYSGTVAGALEAALLGVPAIAVSLRRTRDYVFDFGPSARAAAHARGARPPSSAAGSHLSERQRAEGDAEGVHAHGAREAQSHHEDLRAPRPAWQALLLDRGGHRRVDAARSQ